MRPLRLSIGRRTRKLALIKISWVSLNQALWCVTACSRGRQACWASKKKSYVRRLINIRGYLASTGLIPLQLGGRVKE